MKLENMIIDLLITYRLQKVKKKKIELITNSFSEELIQYDSKNQTEMRISQGIIMSKIPVLQHVSGLEVVDIERIRGNNFLVDFRNKVINLADDPNIEEMEELVHKIEFEFEKYRNIVLIEKQTDCKLFNSTISNLQSFILGNAIPGSTDLKNFVDDRKVNKMNWTAFLASL